MACLLVPAAEAVITTIIAKKCERKEENNKIPPEEQFSKKLKSLNTMLWGGTVMLLADHIWSGEIVPYYPFLTAMETKEQTYIMLHEMATVGVSMAVVVTAVWVAMCMVSRATSNKAGEKSQSKP